MIRHFIVTIAAAALIANAVPLTAVKAAEPPSGNPSAAVFNGRTIDLSRGWQGARACIELGDHTECFAAETAMLDAHPDVFGAATDHHLLGGESIAADCSSSLRLYTGTSYSGSVLTLTARQTTLNLSSYGFDNVTSSYRVGACSSSFYSGANLGGSRYPGPTSANNSAASMVTGWNNVLSSVWIA